VSGDYSIPKHHVEADLKLLHEEPLRVLLHLAGQAARHSGRELPSDLLNGEGRFFPVTVPSDGQVRLVRRRSVVWAEVAREHEQGEEGGSSLVSPDDPESATACVRIQFEDGSSSEGRVCWVLPQGRRRVRDFLDAADPFFPVQVGDRVRLVNLERIALIEPT
jgi:hypothetical protein